MGLHFILGLLLASSMLTPAASQVSTYVPQITLNPIAGKVTTTTFVLEQPECIFTAYPKNDVWLVVAISTALPVFSSVVMLNPYSDFTKNNYYFTLKAFGSSYPCPSLDSSLNSPRVGTETDCLPPSFCNGPLPNPGPYRVKFVVLNSSNLVEESLWSELITLRTGKSAETIDTWPGRRSGSMIVITSILSVLLAFVLAGLVVAVMSSKTDLCGKKIKTKEFVTDTVNISNYNTHHMSTSDVIIKPLAPAKKE